MHGRGGGAAVAEHPPPLCVPSGGAWCCLFEPSAPPPLLRASVGLGRLSEGGQKRGFVGRTKRQQPQRAASEGLLSLG
jgi:hypothetical protein